MISQWPNAFVTLQPSFAFCEAQHVKKNNIVLI